MGSNLYKRCKIISVYVFDTQIFSPMLVCEMRKLCLCPRKHTLKKTTTVDTKYMRFEEICVNPVQYLHFSLLLKSSMYEFWFEIKNNEKWIFRWIIKEKGIIFCAYQTYTFSLVYVWEKAYVLSTIKIHVRFVLLLYIVILCIVSLLYKHFL